MYDGSERENVVSLRIIIVVISSIARNFNFRELRKFVKNDVVIPRGIKLKGINIYRAWIL